MAPRIRAGCENPPDERVLRLAGRQHGVVIRQQVIEAGVTKSMLERRIRHGRFVRLHPGVYAVAGAPRTFEQRCFAAAAWGGAGAVVSHETAAHLWRMTEAPPSGSDVSSPRKRTRPPPSIRMHLSSDLRGRDKGRLRNVPVTSPARTLVDVAGVWPEARVDEALQRAVVTGCVSTRLLRERIAGMPRRGSRGAAVLRRLLRDSCLRLESPLERAVARVLADAELPAFCREHPVYAQGRVFYVDFAWPHFRVGIEADGRRWHSEAGAFEADRERQNLLTTAGWRLLRVTHRQVVSTPGEVGRQVRELLATG
ncbi:MAG TPA: type IV toxin-antitoxin system AbiEi family antitoxin domain-containing protein [Actinomycetota bacterium]|nr:type IV toxin-antitoxin system AbiEi family antitoxin domain-containing protein [Actinomycetota bacterium]